MGWSEHAAIDDGARGRPDERYSSSDQAGSGSARGRYKHKRCQDGRAGGRTEHRNHRHGNYLNDISRRWHYVQRLHDEVAVRGARLRIMTYNVLAKYLAEEHKRELYSRIPGWILHWSNRRHLIVQEILHHNPDVVCLQEVDHMDDLKSALEPAGYSSLYTLRTNGRQDGCALFWKTSTLRATKLEEIRMQDHDLRDNVAQFARLCLNRTNDVPEMALLVANTHLLFNPKRGDIKIAQLRVIAKHLKTLEEQSAMPTVSLLAGDMNLMPDSPIYSLIHTGEMDCLAVNRKSLSGQLEYSGTVPLWSLPQGQLSGHAIPLQQPFHSCNHKKEDHSMNGWSQEHLEIATWPLDCVFGSAHFKLKFGKIACFQTCTASSIHNPIHVTFLNADSLKADLSTVHPFDMCLRVKDMDPNNRDTVGHEPAKLSQRPFAELGMRFVSSHVQATGSEPDFTTAHDKCVGTVDYIFYTPIGTSGLRADIAATLLAPSQDSLYRGLPSSSFASDHISQVSDFLLFHC